MASIQAQAQSGKATEVDGVQREAIWEEARRYILGPLRQELLQVGQKVRLDAQKELRQFLKDLMAEVYTEAQERAEAECQGERCSEVGSAFRRKRSRWRTDDREAFSRVLAAVAARDPTADTEETVPAPSPSMHSARSPSAWAVKAAPPWQDNTRSPVNYHISPTDTSPGSTRGASRSRAGKPLVVSFKGGKPHQAVDAAQDDGTHQDEAATTLPDTSGGLTSIPIEGGTTVGTSENKLDLSPCSYKFDASPNSVGRGEGNYPSRMSTNRSHRVQESDSGQSSKPSTVSVSRQWTTETLAGFRSQPSFAALRDTARCAWEKRMSMSKTQQIKEGFAAGVTEAWVHRRLPVLDPNGTFMALWRPTMLLIVLWAVVTLPFDVAFWWTPPKAYKIAGYVVDVMFLLDLLLTFRVAYVHSGELERNPKKIAIHYAQTWLLFDVISNVPFDWFAGSEGKSRKLVKLLKLPKLIRFVKMLRLLRDQSHYVGVMSMIGILVLAAHYYACFWALTMVGDCPDASICPNVGESYLESLSVAVSALSGNDSWMRFVINEGGSRLAESRDPHSPLKAHEELVTSVMGVLGFIILACLICAVGSAMASLEELGRTTVKMRLRLRKEMQEADVPKHLRVKVEATYEHMWQFGGHKNTMLKDPVLSTDLRRRLAMCAYGPALRRVPMFAKMSEFHMLHLAEKVEIRYYTPGDMLVAAGEKGSELFFVACGEVHAEDSHGNFLKIMREGDFFGELCFLDPGRRRAASVRCHEFARCMVVTAENCLQDMTMEDVLNTIREEAMVSRVEYATRASHMRVCESEDDSDTEK